ncbi:MAG: RluA family pseudouridine synthase [Bacteroidales bacterium]|nr:RluA family pseudouridine synthase [Bacteroidales bacterium]
MFDIAAQILYEDNHLLLLNKRAGQIVQADKTGDACLAEAVKAFLKERDQKPGNVFCGVVHRIDRPVSGVVMFAKTSKALSRMNELVKARAIVKQYWAIVRPRPEAEQGTLHDWLTRNERLNKSFVVQPQAEGAKEALLDYRQLAVSRSGYGLLEVTLHTGRHHQIRVQLSHMGCPIKGDLKYGAARANSDGSISLHARRIEFEHPVRHDIVRVEAPVPNQGLWLAFDEQLTLQSRGMEVSTINKTNSHEN